MMITCLFFRRRGKKAQSKEPKSQEASFYRIA